MRGGIQGLLHRFPALAKSHVRGLLVSGSIRGMTVRVMAVSGVGLLYSLGGRIRNDLTGCVLSQVLAKENHGQQHGEGRFQIQKQRTCQSGHALKSE